jgi:hypothetical protein
MKTYKLFMVVSIFLFASGVVLAQIVSSGSGNWSESSTWTGGTVPGINDDVVISSDHTVTVDADAACKNLSINGILNFEDAVARALTCSGNLTINTAGNFVTKSVTSGPLIHTLILHGDLTANDKIDLRNGSNPNVGVCDIILSGSTDTRILIGGSHDINAVTVDKSGGAKVILQSNFTMNNNSSTAPAILQLTNGVVETGSYELHVRATGTSAGVQGGGLDSYVDGNLVRYMPSGSPSRVYPLGNNGIYRPVEIHIKTSVSNSGVLGKLIEDDANIETTTYTGGIDKVSGYRYYEFKNMSNNNLSIWALEPSYRADDGITAGNTDLRVAYSDDGKTTWNGVGPSDTHTTDLTDPPTFISSDSLETALPFSSQSEYQVAVARKSGTTTNSIPVELTSFSCSIINEGVELQWVTATETNNSVFEIERSVENLAFNRIGFVPGAGTSTEKRAYSFVDQDLNAGSHYSYRLKQIDFDGSFSYSHIINLSLEIPVKYYLEQNFPNPFNPATVIRYHIAEPGFVSLKIYDILGNEVMTIVEELKQPGIYDQVVNLLSLSSGVYFYELEANSFIQRNKMLLQK